MVHVSKMNLTNPSPIEVVVVLGVFGLVDLVLATVVVHGRRGSSCTHCLVEPTATVVVHPTVFGNGRRTRFVNVQVEGRGTRISTMVVVHVV